MLSRENGWLAQGAALRFTAERETECRGRTIKLAGAGWLAQGASLRFTAERETECHGRTNKLADASWLAQGAALRFTTLCVSADISCMPMCRRDFSPGQLQFITTSTYRRIRLFTCQRFCWTFVQTLREVRDATGVVLIGWVLMPEHFHLLIRPEPAARTVGFMRELKKRSAQQIIAALARNQQNSRCRNVLERLRLPSTVHSDSRYRVWQRRYVPFNVFTGKKRVEKLNYMHNNPAKRRLVTSPDLWPWSSFRFYYLNDCSVLRMDRLA